MSPKSGIFDFRTILYILIIMLIILGVAYGLLTGEEGTGTDIKSPKSVLLNPQNFINKDIIVQGIYYSDGDFVANPTQDEDPHATGLNLDLDNIDNVTTVLSDGSKYNFYGKLEWVPNTPVPNSDVILRVTKVKAV